MAVKLDVGAFDKVEAALVETALYGVMRGGS